MMTTGTGQRAARVGISAATHVIPACTGVCSRTPPTCAAPAGTTRRPASSDCGWTSRWPPAFRRRSAGW